MDLRPQELYRAETAPPGFEIGSATAVCLDTKNNCQVLHVIFCDISVHVTVTKVHARFTLHVLDSGGSRNLGTGAAVYFIV